MRFSSLISTKFPEKEGIKKEHSWKSCKGNFYAEHSSSSSAAFSEKERWSKEQGG